MISKKEVQHIAKLARLELTPKEIEKFKKDLSAVLDYFDKLVKEDSFLSARVATKGRKEENAVLFASTSVKASVKKVDVSGVKPTSHIFEARNVMREDEASEKLEVGRRGPRPLLHLRPAKRDSISEKLLELAPETKDGYLKVKSIIKHQVPQSGT